MVSPYQLLKQEWSQCEKCWLCESRRKIVFAKGQFPCDVLFIGEAPGESEDIEGIPFHGPAGHKLQHWIYKSLEILGVEHDHFRIAFTNLVCCKPPGEPPEEAIEACSPRLYEFVRLCKPLMIITVGKLSKQHIIGQAQFDADWFEDDRYMEFVDIVHPASILRNEREKPFQAASAEERAIRDLVYGFRRLL